MRGRLGVDSVRSMASDRWVFALRWGTIQRMVRLAPLLLAAAFALGCPAVGSRPCDTDAECPDGRCREGACGPFCELDAECGTEQLCRDGTCAPRPQCAVTADCARGFTCADGQCRCPSSDVCARNQLCIQGRCEVQPACRSDADCARSGLRCELTQGLCIPPCTSPAQCAPGLDPNAAALLYQCFQGACLRRCTTDATCGSGLICQDGLCAQARCTTRSDCPPNAYCTSATQGRCVEFQLCASTSECAPNHVCERFPDAQCPPGFDCRQTLCRQLPQCLIDDDCPQNPPSYCQDLHCQRTTLCSAVAPCPAGQLCVAGRCYPGGCRGHADCASPQACVEGRCASPPASSAVVRVELAPQGGVLRVGDRLKLTVVAYRFDGSSFPSRTASFTVVDGAGAASTAATVTEDGTVTAASPGAVRVRAQIGASTTSEAALTILPALGTGRRVTVVDFATRRPLAGVAVALCEGATETAACPVAPVEAPTDASGVAAFPGSTAASVSVAIVSTELRADGRPRFERVSVPFTAARDLLLPLRANPVEGSGGFNATLSFSEVRTRGPDWLGFAVMSFADPSDLDPVDLFGDTFFFNEPFTGSRVPIPGAVVAFRQAGLGAPVALKDRAYGLAQAGRRTSIGMAGKVDFLGGGVAGSADPLAYAGALDYALRDATPVPHLPWIVDAQDLDNDGLCADPRRCPRGSEKLPDYFALPGLAFTPRREQLRRTEVLLPNVPAALDTVVVAAVETGVEAGAQPLGLASRTAGAARPDGTRPVQPVVVRSGAPYAGVEAGEPGIWAVAGAFDGQGFFGPGGSFSGHLLRFPSLPAQVTVPPFVPLASGATYNFGTRTFTPGASWAAVSASAQLVRVALLGSQTRHAVYVPARAAQGPLRIPAPPPSTTGVDPASEATVALSVDALRFLAPDDPLDFGGANLVELPTALGGWSRHTP